MTAARVLTIRQPWATLIATGHKRIETRSFATKYRGPLLIHAGARRVDDGKMVGEFSLYRKGAPDRDQMLNVTDGLLDIRAANWTDLPLGAVIAVADLVDCLPIVDVHEDKMAPFCVVNAWGDVHAMLTGEHQRKFAGEGPYGDFTPGRFGWMLDKVRPLATPIPWKGGLGLRHAPDELLAQIEVIA